MTLAIQNPIGTASKLAASAPPTMEAMQRNLQPNMLCLNQAFSYKPDVQAVAATRDGYFPLPDVHRLLRFRAHVDEAQDVVKRSIRRGGSPRFQLSTGENSLLTSSADEDPQKAFPADRCTSKLQRVPVTNGETKFLEDRVLCREAEYFYQVPIHIGELCQGDGVGMDAYHAGTTVAPTSDRTAKG